MDAEHSPVDWQLRLVAGAVGAATSAVAAVVTGGTPRFVGRSRNTPAPIRNVRVAECRLPRDFSS